LLKLVSLYFGIKLVNDLKTLYKEKSLAKFARL